MKELPAIFGSQVFNDRVMKQRLPKDIYNLLKKCIAENKALDIEVANAVANAMKDWAIEHGVTHFTHWFQRKHTIHSFPPLRTAESLWNSAAKS